MSNDFMQIMGNLGLTANLCDKKIVVGTVNNIGEGCCVF